LAKSGISISNIVSIAVAVAVALLLRRVTKLQVAFSNDLRPVAGGRDPSAEPIEKREGRSRKLHGVYETIQQEIRVAKQGSGESYYYSTGPFDIIVRERL
jgi:hypothetical protein